MTQRNELQTKPHQTASSVKPVVMGAAIGLTVISFFVFGVDAPDPAWGKLWRIKPLLIAPVAGAMGGAFYYFKGHLSSGGLNKTVAVVLSLVVFIIVLWLGIVLALNGTMWN